MNILPKNVKKERSGRKKIATKSKSDANKESGSRKVLRQRNGIRKKATNFSAQVLTSRTVSNRCQDFGMFQYVNF